MRNRTLLCGEPGLGGEGGLTGGLGTFGKVMFQGAYTSNLPQEGPTSIAHASVGHRNDSCRALMKSSLNSSIISQQTCSSARWRRIHASPTARATRSSFASLWGKGLTEKKNKILEEEIKKTNHYIWTSCKAGKAKICFEQSEFKLAQRNISQYEYKSQNLSAASALKQENMQTHVVEVSSYS